MTLFERVKPLAILVSVVSHKKIDRVLKISLAVLVEKKIEICV